MSSGFTPTCIVRSRTPSEPSVSDGAETIDFPAHRPTPRRRRVASPQEGALDDLGSALDPDDQSELEWLSRQMARIQPLKALTGGALAPPVSRAVPTPRARVPARRPARAAAAARAPSVGSGPAPPRRRALRSQPRLRRRP